MDRVGGRLMPKRRTTILGLGALAMGSGAAFTSAALENAFEATANFRVVVEDDLLVEAGAAFRDDDDEYRGSSNNEEYAEHDGLFAGDELDDLDPDNLPFAYVDEGVNEDLSTAVATGLGDGGGKEEGFADLLQVTNEGNTERHVGIAFSQVGEDVYDGGVLSSEIADVYEFYSGSSTNNDQISSTEIDDIDGDDGDVESQDGPTNFLTVEPGETKQITLQVDTTDVADDILEAAGHNNPFRSEHNTVNLVQEISIGTEHEDQPN